MERSEAWRIRAVNDPWLNPSWWLVVTVGTSALSAIVMFFVTQVLTYLW